MIADRLDAVKKMFLFEDRLVPKHRQRLMDVKTKSVIIILNFIFCAFDDACVLLVSRTVKNTALLVSAPKLMCKGGNKKSMR